AFPAPPPHAFSLLYPSLCRCSHRPLQRECCVLSSAEIVWSRREGKFGTRECRNPLLCGRHSLQLPSQLVHLRDAQFSKTRLQAAARVSGQSRANDKFRPTGDSCALYGNSPPNCPYELGFALPQGMPVPVAIPALAVPAP